MEKNKAGLVLGIISAIFGLLGGLFWMSCSAAGDAAIEIFDGVLPAEKIQAQFKILLVFSILFGIGGSVTTLVGGMQGYRYRKGGFICSAVGCGCQLGLLITIFTIFGGELVALLVGVSFCVGTMVSFVLAGVQTLITGLNLLNRRNASPARVAPAPAPAPAAPVPAAPVPSADVTPAEEVVAAEEISDEIEDE